MNLRPGSRVGDLLIEAELGRGGMGCVYKARDVSLDRAVAVKVLAPELAGDPRLVERVEREAKAAARIAHPNVTALHGLQRVDGLTLLVFEFVPGGSAWSRVKQQGRLPWREVAAIGADVARGLAAVHEAGLVHRDVKPENVLLGPPAKLADLGLVGVASGQGASALTKSGDLIGTHAYMAPEQAETPHVDARADLYSLGATLYALLAGHPPFSGEGYQLVKKHLLERPRPPSQLDPPVDLPPALERLVLRLLAKDPGDRPAGAHAVVAELEALGREAPRGRPKPVLLAVPLVGVLLAVAAYGLRERTPPGPAPQPVAPEPRRAESSIGWSGEPLPAGMRRGAERPVLIRTTPSGLELEVVPIASGVFLYGERGHSNGQLAQKRRTVTDPLYAGRTEVTWGQYRAFCRATRRPEPPLPGFWSRITDHDRHPVVNVTYADAEAFCAWVGGHLPRAIHWERAARGTDGRCYPWKDSPRWDLAADAPRANTSDSDPFPFTAPVGSFPRGASPDGALDACGNVLEWTTNWDEGEKGPRESREVRGGAWTTGGADARVDRYHKGYAPDERREDLGFRVFFDAR